jgi:hypothetical protein
VEIYKGDAFLRNISRKEKGESEINTKDKSHRTKVD